MEDTIFSDRRRKSDRRKSTQTNKIPAAGCRRHSSRRGSGFFDRNPWWLKASYAEHQLSPELLINNNKPGKTTDKQDNKTETDHKAEKTHNEKQGKRKKA